MEINFFRVVLKPWAMEAGCFNSTPGDELLFFKTQERKLLGPLPRRENPLFSPLEGPLRDCWFASPIWSSVSTVVHLDSLVYIDLIGLQIKTARLGVNS